VGVASLPMRPPEVVAMLALVQVLGCAKPAPVAPTRKTVEARSVSFDFVGQSWVRVPSRVGDGPETKMMIDTGMGVTLLTPEACQRAGCVREGTFTGHRMSGQAVTLGLARVSSLTVAGHRVENAQVAVFESDDVIHRDLGVVGIAGLGLFRTQPVTFDHRAMRVVLETPDSLRAREAKGAKVRVRVKNEGPATDVFLPVEIGPGSIAEMEVDSGSLHMILDDRFMTTLGLDPDAPSVVRKEGRDETGQPFVRRYAPLPGEVRVQGVGAPRIPSGTSVMFQKIIHDGLLGQEFLRAHVVTFDVPHSAMIFER
jgi:hypothetical protein